MSPLTFKGNQGEGDHAGKLPRGAGIIAVCKIAGVVQICLCHKIRGGFTFPKGGREKFATARGAPASTLSLPPHIGSGAKRPALPSAVFGCCTALASMRQAPAPGTCSLAVTRPSAAQESPTPMPQCGSLPPKTPTIVTPSSVVAGPPSAPSSTAGCSRGWGIAGGCCYARPSTCSPPAGPLFLQSLPSQPDMLRRRRSGRPACLFPPAAFLGYRSARRTRLSFRGEGRASGCAG